MPTYVEKLCEFCHQPFQAYIREINRGNGRFCSIKCSSSRKHPAKEPNVICAYCNKPFYKRNGQLNGSKSGLYFCCREHKDFAQRIGGIKEIQPDHYGDINTNYREFALRNAPQVCNRCGYDKYVIVHHKDENRKNNSPENLEILCPNCHALEHWKK